MGDAAYELMVREYIIKRYGSMPVGKLHFTAVKMVRAEFQSQLYEEILPFLDETELSLLKRGRNAHSQTVPKNANPVEYRRATGIETLFGWLYLSEKKDRIKELFSKAVTLFEQNEVE